MQSLSTKYWCSRCVVKVQEPTIFGAGLVYVLSQHFGVKVTIFCWLGVKWSLTALDFVSEEVLR